MRKKVIGSTATIKHWAEDDRPREKLLLKGASALSNAELLAILINNGTKNFNALDIAKKLLQVCNDDLQKITQLSAKEITALKIPGLGMAKAITLVAAFQIGVRREAQFFQKPVVKQSNDVALYLQKKLQHLKVEEFWCVYLNQGNKIIHAERVSEGGIAGTVADSRIILKNAILNHAVSIIVAHNHPSGNLTPSQADKDITKKIAQGASLMDIKLLDHIIISNEGYFSFADEGLM